MGAGPAPSRYAADPRTPRPPMPPESAPRSFADDCRATASELRAALAAVYADVGADAARPQVVARRFRLNKNLTWKIAKVLQSTDPLETVPLVPGKIGRAHV